MREVRIYYKDLIPEAQQDYLWAVGAKSPSQLNLDIPLAIIEIDDEEAQITQLEEVLNPNQ